MPTLQLSIRQGDGDAIVVTVTNDTKKAITVVAHGRYWSVELENARGQFVKGAPAAASFPAASDFVTVPPGETTELLVLPIVETDFPAVPTTTTARVTYKVDSFVPNLPTKLKKSLFSGPIDAVLPDVQLFGS